MAHALTPAIRAFGPRMAERLRLAAERLLAYDFEPWFYGDSIGFEGLIAASRLLEDRRYADFAVAFLTAWAAHDEPRGLDDNTAPGRVLCGLAAARRDDTLSDAAHRLARYLVARRRINGTSVTFEDAGRSLREPYGAASLSDEERAFMDDPGAGIYVDCLHFDAPFFAAMARLAQGGGWAERATAEASGYVYLLQDPATGLFHHFWLERRGSAYGLGWGRGQGWALLGLLDVLHDLPAGAPGRSDLQASAANLVDAMLARQRADGGWHAMAGIEASGDETSTAAFMVIGFLRAARLGIGDAAQLEAAARMAWYRTASSVDDTGLLTGVSAAVYSSTLDVHYHAVPRGFDVPWGQGPLLLAAAELAAVEHPDGTTPGR